MLSLLVIICLDGILKFKFFVNIFKRSYISNFKTKTFYLPCLKSNLKHVLFLNVHRSFTTAREKPPAVISVPKVVIGRIKSRAQNLRLELKLLGY